MSRPKYKEMYLEELRRANYWTERCNNLDKELSEARNKAVTTAQDRAQIRNNYMSLYREVSDLLSTFRRNLFQDATIRKGWITFPSLAPEDADFVLRRFDGATSYVNRTRPPAM